eukprot:TRINITY_DN1747_c1_g2_i1.p2 TRINITY_DN1747_c1_g2~~TRINITY_DN1747_c1_g2_i1.p2  ORF type:complete len:382 (+),score=113.03 TRINITY_DN1747_c1_g2_i1:139-1146(+)
MDELHDAAKEGDAGVVRRLVEGGVPVDELDAFGRSALMIAAAAGKVSALRVLLELGASSSAVDSEGHSALWHAVTQAEAQSTRILLEHDARALFAPDLSGPLLVASFLGSLEICTLLVKYGADVNCLEPYESTPLFAAAQNGHQDVCAFLLDHKAQVDTPRLSTGETPLHRAAVNGHVDVCKVLLQHHCDVGRKIGGDLQAVHLAVLMGHHEVCGLLLRNGADPHAGAAVDGMDERAIAIGIATVMGRQQCVKELLPFATTAELKLAISLADLNAQYAIRADLNAELQRRGRVVIKRVVGVASVVAVVAGAAAVGAWAWKRFKDAAATTTDAVTR